MILHITERHIRSGFPDHPNKCPIALALQEKLRKSQAAVFVGRRRIWIDGTEYFLPRTARQFVFGYDARKFTEAQAVYLPVPEIC